VIKEGFHCRPRSRAGLTRREIEVLKELADGKVLGEIGNRHTVKNLIYNIRLKMNARTSIQAVVMALKAGWIDGN